MFAYYSSKALKEEGQETSLAKNAAQMRQIGFREDRSSSDIP
jgi:hypothetical protein